MRCRGWQPPAHDAHRPSDAGATCPWRVSFGKAPNGTWAFVDVDQPTSSPSHPREPGAGPCHGQRLGASSDGAAPTIKPPRRRAWIEPTRPADVFAEVVQHVHQRIAHFSRCAEQARVMPISPDSPMATEDPVHRLRHANREPAHTALELRRPIRLYHQVQMIRLDAEVEHAKACRTGGSQCVSCGKEETSVSERGDAG